MRTILMGLFALTLAMPLTGQDMDPTMEVEGSGELPTGWMVRFDAPRRGPAPTVADVDFRTMGDGLHITTGPAGTYYMSDAATGDFTVSGTFSQSRAMGHESYGLVIGGSNMQDSNQTYVYFVIRPEDGQALINHRTSDERPRQVVPFTAYDAVNVQGDDGSATNTIAIQVQGETVNFMVNGTTVQSMTKAEMGGVTTDGMVGIRINHNLDLHIADFGVSGGM